MSMSGALLEDKVNVAGGNEMATRLKSILGGSVGNLVEWYDWYAYSIAKARGT